MRANGSRGIEDGAGATPAQLHQPRPDDSRVDTGTPCPICKYERFGANGDPVITAFIPALYSACRPPHIALFVMTIIVNAVKRMFWRRAIANVVYKVLVGLEKHFNTATAVTSILRMIRVIASSLCSGEYPIFRLMSVAVSKFANFLDLTEQTSATLLVARFQLLAHALNDAAAFAPTPPHRLSVCSGSGKSKDGKTVIDLTCQVDKVGTFIRNRFEGNGNICASHSVFTSIENGLIRPAREVSTQGRATLILPSLMRFRIKFTQQCSNLEVCFG